MFDRGLSTGGEEDARNAFAHASSGVSLKYATGAGGKKLGANSHSKNLVQLSISQCRSQQQTPRAMLLCMNCSELLRGSSLGKNDFADLCCNES